MRRVWSTVGIVVLVALALGVSAQAGGNGAMKVGLYVGYYPDNHSEIQQPPVQVGNVIFAQAAGKMQVTIHLQDAEPDMEFMQVFLVPLEVWDLTPDYYSMTTNGKGKATIHFSAPMPEDDPDPFYIKAIVREYGREGVVYVTDRIGVVRK